MLQVITCQYVENTTSENLKKKKVDTALQDVINIGHRNAGKTSNLSKKAQKVRNEKISEMVDYASFGDLKS